MIQNKLIINDDIIFTIDSYTPIFTIGDKINVYHKKVKENVLEKLVLEGSNLVSLIRAEDIIKDKLSSNVIEVKSIDRFLETYVLNECKLVYEYECEVIGKFI